MDDVTLILRLLWIPEGTRADRAFEVAVTRSLALPLDEAPAWRLWHRYTSEPMLPPDELYIVTDLDEPQPLPPNAEFVLMMSFTGGGSREGAEQFYDWRALPREEAEAICLEAWNGDLATMAQAASQVVRLPATQTPH